jgi:hypothetical protein
MTWRTTTEGKPKFNVNRLNPVCFSGLRNRIVASRDKGISATSASTSAKRKIS